jgi:hypothetical protein
MRPPTTRRTTTETAQNKNTSTKCQEVRRILCANAATWKKIEKAAKNPIKHYKKKARKNEQKSLTLFGYFMRATTAFAQVVATTSGVAHAVNAVAQTAGARSNRNNSASEGAGEGSGEVVGEASASWSGSGNLARSSSFHGARSGHSVQSDSHSDGRRQAVSGSTSSDEDSDLDDDDSDARL